MKSHDATGSAQPSRWRRRSVVVLVWLCIGAVANVIVAWACVYHCTTRSTMRIRFATYTPVAWPIAGCFAHPTCSAHALIAATGYTRESAFDCCQIIDSQRQNVDAGAADDLTASPRSVRHSYQANPPRDWGTRTRATPEQERKVQREMWIARAGWPLPSVDARTARLMVLRGSATSSFWILGFDPDRERAKQFPIQPGDCVEGGLPSEWVVPWKHRACVLPIRPIWTGLVVNAAFYAGLCWCVARMVGQCWRWARGGVRQYRGRCRACGYSMDGLRTCSECGRAA